MESGHLDACLFDWPGRLHFLRRVPAILLRAHLGLPGVTYERRLRASAWSDTETWVQVDGELLGTLPMTFESVPASLSIIVRA